MNRPDAYHLLMSEFKRVSAEMPFSDLVQSCGFKGIHVVAEFVQGEDSIACTIEELGVGWRRIAREATSSSSGGCCRRIVDRCNVSMRAL